MALQRWLAALSYGVGLDWLVQEINKLDELGEDMQ